MRVGKRSCLLPPPTRNKKGSDAAGHTFALNGGESGPIENVMMSEFASISEGFVRPVGLTWDVTTETKERAVNYWFKHLTVPEP